MKLVLCDDQKTAFEELQPLLEKFSRKKQIQTELLYFSKPSLLFQSLQKEPIDLIFMDLEFCDADEDGIVWLKKIKQTLWED